MNPETTDKPVWHFGIIFVVACLLFVALVVVVKLSVSVPAIDDIRATETKSLDTADWIDQGHNLVRLPIETALQLYANAAKNPAAARADLIARAEKAAAPLPKVVPKPSAFE